MPWDPLSTAPVIALAGHGLLRDALGPVDGVESGYVREARGRVEVAVRGARAVASEDVEARELARPSTIAFEPAFVERLTWILSVVP
jgi:hypothetical protein